jgi:hypothetical protein
VTRLGSQVAPSVTGPTRASGDGAELAGGDLGDGPSGGMYASGGGRSGLWRRSAAVVERDLTVCS